MFIEFRYNLSICVLMCSSEKDTYVRYLVDNRFSVSAIDSDRSNRPVRLFHRRRRLLAHTRSEIDST